MLAAHVDVTDIKYEHGIWFHAASVGEVNASLPLVKFFHEKCPNVPILYTVMTKTGQARAKNALKFKPNAQVLPFPFDNSSKINFILSEFKPIALIVVETELWPNLILLAKRRGVPSFLVNARLSPNSLTRYMLVKRIMSKVLNSFNIIFARYEEDKKKFLKLGAVEKKIIVSGSLKYDTLVANTSLKDRLSRKELGYDDSDFLVVFGSVRSKEEDFIINCLRDIDLNGHKDIKVVIAPRHLERAAHIASKLRVAGIKFVLRTQRIPPNGRVLILDTIGELTSFYGISNLAFVGGSLANYGGHNILEPASLGVPVIFGPFVWNVRHEAMGLVKCGGGFFVKDANGLVSIILNFYKNRQKALEAGLRAQKFTKEKAGVAYRIGHEILSFLKIERGRQNDGIQIP